MEKLHRDIKRMVDGVSIPEDRLNDTVQNSLLIAKRKKKRSIVKKHHVIASIASILVLTFGVLLFNSYEHSVSGDFLKSALYQNGDEGLKRLVTEGEIQDLSLEEEDQGIKVIVKEGYLDNHQLAVSLQINPESIVDFPEETSLTYEWFIDGKPFGSTGWDGILKKELISKGGILFTFTDTWDFPEKSNLELRIYKINEVAGNWSFQFQLDKQKEYIVISDVRDKQDTIGNQLQVTNAELTPSQLQLSTNATLLMEESDLQEYELSVIGIGADGTMYLSSEVSSNFFDSPKIDGKKTYYRKTEIPRGVDVYSYRIIPYLATYRKEEIPVDHGKAFNHYKSTIPFAEGETLGTESPIKVEKIDHNKENTVVTFDMDLLVPEFPMILDRNSDEVYYPISFRLEGDTIQVTYPKVNISKDLQFYMYDVSYQVFPDLETTINFK